MKVNKFATESEWGNWIGKEIVKHSNKPFKSGNLVGVPIGTETNPYSGKKAFRMRDCDSLVDCFQCKLR